MVRKNGQSELRLEGGVRLRVLQVHPLVPGGAQRWPPQSCFQLHAVRQRIAIRYTDHLTKLRKWCCQQCYNAVKSVDRWWNVFLLCMAHAPRSGYDLGFGFCLLLTMLMTMTMMMLRASKYDSRWLI